MHDSAGLPMWGGHSCPPPLKLMFRFGIYSSVWSHRGTCLATRKNKGKGGGQECPPHTPLDYFDLLIFELLIVLIASRQFKRIRQHAPTLLHAGDHVGAAEPVRFGEIGLRPARGMVRMRVVEADDVLAALAAFPLNA